MSFKMYVDGQAKAYCNEFCAIYDACGNYWWENLTALSLCLFFFFFFFWVCRGIYTCMLVLDGIWKGVTRQVLLRRLINASITWTTTLIYKRDEYRVNYYYMADHILVENVVICDLALSICKEIAVKGENAVLLWL